MSKECYQKQAACIERATSFAVVGSANIHECSGWKTVDWHAAYRSTSIEFCHGHGHSYSMS